MEDNIFFSYKLTEVIEKIEVIDLNSRYVMQYVNCTGHDLIFENMSIYF